jgi:hypothetical protein
MMLSHVGAVAAATEVEAITEVPPISGVERFVVVVTALPVEDTELRDAAMDIVQYPAVR